MSQVGFVELYDLMPTVVPFLTGADRVLLDLITDASSQDIGNGETRIESMNHGGGVKEIGVSGAGQ